MTAPRPTRRPTGIPPAGDLPWGSDFCVFYASADDLLDIVVPFVGAGLESGEQCWWEVGAPLALDATIRRLAGDVPGLAHYTSRGQVRIVGPSADGPSGWDAVERRLEEALLAGFDGLRIVRHAVADTAPLSLAENSSLNVIVADLYARAELDAIGFMDVVQRYRFALVSNGGRWEVLEGSATRAVRHALERSEQQLQTLFANMSEGFAYHRIVLDGQGRPCDYVFLDANPAFERLTGLEAAKVRGRRVTQVLPGIERDPTDWIGKYGRVALTGEAIRFESHAAALDRWYSVSAFCPHKGHFAVVFTDITDRRRMEAERRAAEERLRVTVRSIGDAVIATDGSGRVTLMNRVAEDLTGWSEADALGRPLGEVCRLVDDETGAAVADPGTGSPTLVARNGRRIAISASAAPVRGDTQLGVVLAFRDVSAARLAEHERNLALEFLRLVNEHPRTADLARAAATFFRARSGCAAAVIRLGDREDGPRYEARNDQAGFVSPEHDPGDTDEPSSESVADFPLHAGGSRLGLLELVDRGRGGLSPERFALWARLATYLAVALARTRAEEALRDAEGRLRTLGDQIPGGAIYQHVLRPDGRVEYAYISAGVVRLFGMPAERVMSHPSEFRALIADEDRALVAAAEARSARDLTPLDCEFRQRTVGGEIRWVHCRSMPRRLDDGSVAWDGIVVDITARRRADEERDRLLGEIVAARELMAADLDGMTRLQKVGSLVRGDENISTVLGEVVDAAIGVARADFGTLQVLDAKSSTLKIVAHRNLPDWWLEYWNQVGEGHGACGAALERGARVIVEDVEQSPIFAGTPAGEIQRRVGIRAVQSTPLVSRAGRPLGMFSTHWRTPGRPADRTLRLLDLLGRQAADIIERSQAEEALRTANTQLIEADRRKNEFLAVLSHELRNPLAPIKSGLYVLDRAAPGGDQARRVQAVIARQAEQLTRLVDDLLDVTRISRNKIELQRQRLELQELTRRSIEDHRGLFEAAAVEVGFLAAGEPVHVDGDWNRLAQIVGNLLQNAAKFTPPGGRVTVAVWRDVRSGIAGIRVTDTGVGMTREMLGRLFVPFTQADATLDRSKGGLGLGLALVKGLVELHGGEVVASSAGLGQGSEFVVRLPLALVPASAAPPAAPGAPPAPHRVLVVEDNVDAAEMLREMLEFACHLVAVEYNGPNGIARARQFRPDVVLCDIGLPGMSGYDVARAFREDESLRGAYLVALSGYARPEDLQRAAEAGFDRHLAKPASLEALEALLAARTSGAG